MYVDFAKEVALFVGRQMRKRFFSESFESHLKSKSEYVTSVDIESEAYIRKRIRETFPEHGIVGEEKGGRNADKEYVWVIDPLDGTHNFMIHMPFFNISIALEKNGEPIMGVVYNPITDEMFYAEKGSGAFLNGINLKVNPPKEKQRRYFGFCFTKDVIDEAMKIYTHYNKTSGQIKKLGSAALEISYVAAGRLDGFIGYGLKIWDFKAAQVIAREAGLIADNAVVNNREFILVAHESIYDDIKKEVMEIITP